MLFFMCSWLKNLHVLAATLSFDVDVSHHLLLSVAPYFCHMKYYIMGVSNLFKTNFIAADNGGAGST